jgi:hypothetical protein
MNVKINKAEHEFLCTLNYKEYLFGSQLHGISNEGSDYDYIRIIDNSFYDNFNSLAIYLPNIHSWQYDDVSTQYVWMTEKQFYFNLFSGDGNTVCDVVLLSDEFKDSAMFLSKTYKIIKGYLGVAKRDLKLHPNNVKKLFHAFRSLYMAKELLENRKPTVDGIKTLKFETILPSRDELFEMESTLREKLNTMLNAGEIDLYPKFKEGNRLAQIMVNTNNIREFKY